MASVPATPSGSLPASSSSSSSMIPVVEQLTGKRTRHSSRSSISCLACRETKVRCLRLAGDVECSRCRQRGIECIVPRSKRSRRSEPLPTSVDQGLATTTTAADDTARHSRSRTPLCDPLRLLADASQRTVVEHADAANSVEEHNHQQSTGASRPEDDDEEDDEDGDGDNDGDGWRERNRRSGYRTYFRHRMFASKPDTMRSINPISLGLVTEELAHLLLVHFHATLNKSCHLLDPALHTLQEVRKHALLSSAIFLLAARTSISPAGIDRVANRLQQHIDDSVIPTVLLQDCRSLEIVQGFLLLATYHPPTRVAKSDRAWSFLQHAVRIATCLDDDHLHPSPPPPPPPSQTTERGESHTAAQQRQVASLRNLQRTQLHLHGLEKILASNLGRRAILRENLLSTRQPAWYRHPAAIDGDFAVFMLCELGKVMTRTLDLRDAIRAETMPSSSGGSGGVEHLHALYQKTADAELEAWFALCRDRAQIVKTAAGAVESDVDADLAVLELFYHYFSIFFTAAKAMGGSTHEAQTFFSAPHVSSLYLHAVGFAKTLEWVQPPPPPPPHPSPQQSIPSDPLLSSSPTSIPRSVPLNYTSNALFVSGAYIGLIALMLLERCPSRVDEPTILNAVETLVSRFKDAGSITPYRNGCAIAYSHYLAFQVEVVLRRRAGAGAEAAREGDGVVGGMTAPPGPTIPAQSFTHAGGGTFAIDALPDGLVDEGLLMLLNAGNEQADLEALQAFAMSAPSSLLFEPGVGGRVGLGGTE